MSIVNISPKTLQVFNECGFDILSYFDNLNENMDIVLAILDYHTNISNPNLSLRERKQASAEFFEFLENDEVQERLNNFVKEMTAFDKDMVKCIMSKDCEGAKQVVGELIPDIDNLTNFVKRYKMDIKKAMKWVFDFLDGVEHCGAEKKMEQYHKNICGSDNTMFLVIISIFLFLFISFMMMNKFNQE